MQLCARFVLQSSRILSIPLTLLVVACGGPIGPISPSPNGGGSMTGTTTISGPSTPRPQRPTFRPGDRPLTLDGGLAVAPIGPGPSAPPPGGPPSFLPGPATMMPPPPPLFPPPAMTPDAATMMPPPSPPPAMTPDAGTTIFSAPSGPRLPCSNFGPIVFPLSGPPQTPMESKCSDSWTLGGRIGVSFRTGCNHPNSQTLNPCDSQVVSAGFGFPHSPVSWIFVSSMHLDLRNLGCIVSEVEVETTDYTAPGALAVTLYDDQDNVMDRTTNTATGYLNPESLIVNDQSTGWEAASFSIDGCEAEIRSITLR